MDSVAMAVSRSSLEEKLKSLKEVEISPCDVQWSGRMRAVCSSFGELWVGRWRGQQVVMNIVVVVVIGDIVISVIRISAIIYQHYYYYYFYQHCFYFYYH